MTLRVLKNRLNPAVGLFNATVLKNTGIIILLVVAMLIFCPGFFIAELQEQTFRPQDFNERSPEYLNILFGTCGILSVALVTVANYINFSYLYKKNSSDVFHALPLTRAKLLLSRAAAGFVSVLIPLTVGYAALYALTAFYPTYVLGTLSQIASAYLVNVICVMAASAYSLIFIVCAGSAFDLALSYIGFNIALPVIGMIISSVAEEYLVGYSSENMVEILRIISPPAFCGMGAAEFAFSNAGSGVGYSLARNSGFIIQTVIYFLIFTAAALLLYNYRRAERGGQAYAYKFLYVICSVLAGICGGYLLSRIFILPSNANDISVIAGISFIAGALITTVAYGAVTERGFKRFRKSLVYGGVSTVVYIVILVVIAGGAFGFSKRIPDIKNINVASISLYNDQLDIEDSSQADKILALHRAIIEKNADDDMKDIVDTPHTYIYISYELKDKSTMHRRYFADVKKVEDEIFAMYTSDARFEEIYRTIDRIKSKNLYFEAYYEERGETVVYVITKEQIRAFAETYRQELNKLGKSVLCNEQAGVNVQIYVSDEGYYGSEFSINLTKDFTETLALLETFESVPKEADGAYYIK